MVISSAGGSNGGNRLRRYWGLRHEEEEYGCTIYFDATNSRPLRKICSEAGSICVSTVVGAGGTVSIGVERESGGRVGCRGGAMRVGSGAGRDSRPGLKVGSTTIVT